ncbi:MAG: hypothetical protein ACI85Q_000679 [Salibacteraceae bacterium]|jgi:hypothetical protein
MNRFLVFIISICILTGNVKSQNKEVSTYIQELYTTWDSIYVNYSVNHDLGDSTIAINLIKNLPPISQKNPEPDVSLESLRQDVLLNEAKTADGDIGLGIRGDYMYNLEPGIGFEDNLFYEQKFRVGLEMDLLNGGYFANHDKARIKYNELEIRKRQSSEETKKEDRYLKWHNIIYQFNRNKIEILKSREQLAANRVSMATKLNYLKYMSQKDLINTISSHAEIQSMLNIYRSYNEQLASELHMNDSVINQYPLIDIDYSYSYKLMTSDDPDSIAELIIENIRLADKTINNFKVKPFASYNFYDLVSSNPSYRSYFSVGLTVAAPLNFNSKNRADLRAAKTNLALVPSVSTPEVQQDVLTQFYEFRYKLKQYTSLYHKRENYKELIRQERVKHAISPINFNPISALKLMDDLMQVDIEMIDTKQQMYLKALNIYTDLPYSKAQELIYPIELSKSTNRDSKHINSIYVWSSTILKNDPSVLAHYINLNPFSRATISLNNKLEARNKTFQFIDFLVAENIEVEIMIGNNKLINGGFDAYIQKLTIDVDWTKITGIHLDVEPHINNDWHENKIAYLAKYHLLLESASAFCTKNGLTLGVSIPTHYPEEDIYKIFKVVDRVYFMCYENVKTDYIVRKTEKYPTKKKYIALRTNDFNNRLEMEDKFIELNKKTKVAGYLVHDLGSLLEFDSNSLNKK